MPTQVHETEIIRRDDALAQLYEIPRDLETAFEWFLQTDVANGDAAADTQDGYRREVRNYLRWCRAQAIDPLQATRIHVEIYREFLRRENFSPSSRAYKLTIVRRLYEAAVKYDLIKVNPALKVKGGKDLTPPEDKIKSMSGNALRALVDVIPLHTLRGQRDRAAIGLMFLHGLRRVEIHRMDGEHLSFMDELCAEFARHDPQNWPSVLDMKLDTPSVEVIGKGQKRRRIYLREDSAAAVVEYLSTVYRLQWPLSGPLFRSVSNFSRGKRISRRGIDKVLDGYMRKALIKREGIGSHALRHSYGTLSIAGGAEVVEVQASMGHESLDTTSIYVRAINRIKKNPANFIDVGL